MASVVASNIIEGNLWLRCVLGSIALRHVTRTTHFSHISPAHPIFDKGITLRALLDIINRAFKNDGVIIHLAASRLKRYNLLV